MAVSVPLREAGGDHVGVVDGLHLVDVVTVNTGIECSVESVEQVKQLERSAGSCDDLEPINLSEANGGRVEHLEIQLLQQTNTRRRKFSGLSNITSEVDLFCFRFSATVLGNIWVIKLSAFFFSLFRALAFTLTLAEKT